LLRQQFAGFNFQVNERRSDFSIGLGLLMVAIFWGANNAATKYLVHTWPADWVGGTRLLCAGFLMMAIFRFTPFFGKLTPINRELNLQLWLRPGLWLGIYILVFTWALRFSPASHVVLYLGTSPIWTLLWDHPPSRTWASFQRYLAALMATCGVLVLFWPTLGQGKSGWIGEVLGMMCSILWANYGIQGRHVSKYLSGVELSAHSMWRAGLITSPLALYQLGKGNVVWRTDLVLVQIFCIVFGGVVAYAFWNIGLKAWPTSKVYLFNNLMPITTMAFSYWFLNEPVTRTFTVAMILVAGGVILGQTRWEKILGEKWFPPD